MCTKRLKSFFGTGVKKKGSFGTGNYDDKKRTLLVKVEILEIVDVEKVENRFFCSKDQSVIAIFYTSWYNQSIKRATATQGG